MAIILALQKMLKICEKFANDHNLKFSTDPNPTKCKTKCIAFMKRPRQLKDMELCGNNLPWVNQFKHLGSTITNQGCFTNQDMNIKKACFVNKNIGFNQQFYFADARTKFRINEIYIRSHLWNLFNEEAIQFENLCLTCHLVHTNTLLNQLQSRNM